VPGETPRSSPPPISRGPARIAHIRDRPLPVRLSVRTSLDAVAGDADKTCATADYLRSRYAAGAARSPYRCDRDWPLHLEAVPCRQVPRDVWQLASAEDHRRRRRDRLQKRHQRESRSRRCAGPHCARRTLGGAPQCRRCVKTGDLFWSSRSGPTARETNGHASRRDQASTTAKLSPLRSRNSIYARSPGLRRLVSSTRIPAVLR